MGKGTRDETAHNVLEVRPVPCGPEHVAMSGAVAMWGRLGRKGLKVLQTWAEPGFPLPGDTWGTFLNHLPSLSSSVGRDCDAALHICAEA